MAADQDSVSFLRDMPRSELLACVFGAASWALGALMAAVLYMGRDDEGLEAIGTGLVFIALLTVAVLTSVGTLVAVNVRIRAQPDAVRPVTWVAAAGPVLPAVATVVMFA